MPNEVFNVVVSELETYIGDILARGVTKKALEKVGSSMNMVSQEEMYRALDIHVTQVLHSFMSPEKAKDCVRGIKKKVEKYGKA